ncbi:MAG: hypothetical protein ACK5C3_07590 [bacterium]
MMRVSRITSVLSGTAVLGCTFFGTAAFGQCTPASSADFIQNDGGCPVTGTPDTNGGCNASPPAFQATGTLTGSNSFTINGTLGQDPVANSRDLDWYTFTVTQPCFVNFSMVMTNGGQASTSTLIFFGNPADCDSFGGFGFNTCPALYPEQYIATPGTYSVVVTTDFAPAGVVCNSPYTLTVSSRTSPYSQCGSGAANCGVANPSVGGCQDVQCCDRICTIDPLCCDIGWSASCAAQAQLPVSSGGCGIFVYNCNPPANAPANDCATAAPTIALDTVVNFDNTNATTDGPNNGQCGSDTAKDVWFAVLATASGNMNCFVTSPTQDVVLSAYNYGTAGAPYNGALLDANFEGCVDVAGIGGENGTLVGVTAGNWYLWRVGIWGNPGTADPGVAGAGTVEFSIEQVVWDTGRHAPICNTANGTLTNLGLSSGAIGATAPQRWLAVPFTVSDPAGTPDSWRLTFLTPEGFIPAGVVNERINWIIWSRTAFNAPVYATSQIASGSAAFPALGANGEAFIPVDLVLEPGDYYMTAFASAVGNPCRPNDAQNIFSNFAWFIGAPSGIRMTDATGPFFWRSAVQPGSGPADEVVIAGGSGAACEGGTTGAFTRTTLAGFTDQPCGSGLLEATYRPAFQILGFPEAGNNCPADLDGNGSVGASDLSTLLNNWGTNGAGDLDGNGSVGASDLSTLLNAWGACP